MTIFFLCCPLGILAESYTFAFVPQQSAKKLANKWQPILDYLGKETGNRYVFVTAKDIPTFESRLAQEKYDFAYMNPYHFTIFNEKPGYQAMAKQRNKKIKGIIIVHKDSNIQNLEDLRGASIAFPAPAAFAATLLISAEFNKRQIDINPKYVSSHDSVYLNVSREILPAGGGVMRTLGNANQQVQKQLRVLWTTQGFTPHAFAYRKEIAPEVVKKLQLVLLQMHEHNEGIALLKRVNFKGFDFASNEDWNDVRELGINIAVGE